MKNHVQELFLLTTTLSQLRNKDKIVQLFIESMNDIFHDYSFVWFSEKSNKCNTIIEVCTRHKIYGFISFTTSNPTDTTIYSLISNATQLLAILLEKIEQENLLLDQKNHLQLLVDKQTSELHHANLLLKEELDVRRHAEEQLESRNALLSALINSPNNIIIFSLDKEYCYTAFNEKHREEMKKVWDADIKLGVNLLDCMTIPELRGLAKKSMDRALNGETFSEVQFQPGPDMYYEFRWNPIFQHEEIIGITAFISDITERKLAEQELIDSKLKLSRFIANLPAFFFTFKKSPNGVYHFPYASPGIKKLYGLDAEDVREDMTPLHMLAHPEDRPHIEASIDEAFKTLESFNIEYRVCCPGMPQRWFECRSVAVTDVDGSPLWHGIILDITERKHTKEALQKSQEILNMSQHLAKVGGWEYDVKSGKSFWTEELYRIHEIPYDPTIDHIKESINCYDPEDRSVIQAAFKRAYNTGEPYDLEFPFTTSKGNHLWIRTTARPVFKKGKVVRVVGNLMDITEQKNAERERRAHLHFWESISSTNRAIQGSNDLERMMIDVLDLMISAFDCDRAWLVYPCDPDAKSWSVPMERAKPEYPGACALGIEIPTEADVAEVFRIQLASDSPVKFGAGMDNPLPENVSQEFGIKSFISVALHPKVGKPWQFGMHQCSYVRIWTGEEEKLFQEISRRLEDALTSLLLYRNLQESEKRFREIFDNVLDSLFLFEITDDGHFRNLKVNRAFERSTGMTSDQLVGKIIEEIVPPEVAEIVNKKYRHCVETGIPIEEEAQLDLPSGKRYFHSVLIPARNQTGKIYRIIGISRDITESKLAGEALRESEKKYRTLIQKIQTAIVVHAVDTSILTCNSKAQDLLGLSEDQLLGKKAIDPDWHFLREDGTKMLKEEFPANLVIATSCPLRNYVVGVHRSDKNDYIWSLVNADPVFDNENKIEQVIVTFIDITDRKIAQEALRENEQRYRLSQEAARIGTWEYDINTEYFWGSDEAKRIYGFDPEAVEFSTETVESCIPDRDRVHQALIDLIEKGKPYKLEFEIRPADGSVPKIISSIAELFLDKHGVPVKVIGVIQDITERKQTEEEIKLLSFALDNVQEQAFLIDLEGRFVYVNRKACNTLEYNREELMRMSVYDVDPELTPEHGKQLFAELLRSKTMTLETRHRTRSGRIFPVEITNSGIEYNGITYSFSLARDITERKQMEQALKKSEEIFRTLAENSPDYIARYDLHGRILYINPALEEVFNYSASDLLGIKPKDIVCIDEFRKYEETIANVAATGAETKIDLVLPDLGKGERYHDVRFVAERGNSGAISGVLAIGRDVTEQKKVEQRIIELNQELEKRVTERTFQLETANKELETFAYSVSHDLQAPLRGIDGFSQILLEEYWEKLDEQGRDYLKRVRAGTQRMAQLIDDILKLSRISRSKMSIHCVNLSEIAKEISESQKILQPNRDVEYIIQPDVVVKGDERLLRIVMENLFDNAWKFTSGQNNVRIEFGAETQKEEQIYFVRDNGAGFDMKYSQKLFGAFQRLHTEKEFPGTGIGLATVQRIIHRHGGKVWAEGEVEKGATIFISLSPT